MRVISITYKLKAFAEGRVIYFVRHNLSFYSFIPNNSKNLKSLTRDASKLKVTEFLSYFVNYFIMNMLLVDDSEIKMLPSVVGVIPHGFFATCLPVKRPAVVNC